jgi:dolichyl-diphosphooligosaccharide--protein glycosyltransferase
MSFRRITNSFRNLKDRIRASVNLKSYNVLFFIALVIVFLLAILIRLSPILREPIMKAFDPWIQYYHASYLSEHTWYEYFNWFDYKSWYPSGIRRANLRPGLIFTVVVIHQTLNSLGIPISIYDVCYYFPAFMGGLTVLAMYFLGKEVLDKRCGLFAAFFLALSPGYMQRTTAGFFDNETVGVFSIIMALLFFAKALKSGRISHSIIGGVFLGYLSLSWGGEDFIYFLIPLICGILILINKYDQNVLTAYAGVQGTGLLISSLFIKFNFSKFFTSLNLGGIFLFTIFLILYHLFYTKRDKYPNLYRKTLNFVKWGVIPGAIILASIVWINPDIIPFGFGSRFQSILSPLLRNQIYIIASVAEQIPSPWSIFYYNTLIPFMLIPLGIYFAFRRLHSVDIIVILFVLTLLYFTGSMIRIILILAPAVALIGAYGLVSVLNIFGSYIEEKKLRVSRKRKRQLRSKRTLGKTEIYGVYLLVGFLCIAQVVHATDISINQMSYSQIVAGGVLHDWEESLTWMNTNLDGTTVVVSWWDYGYWLTPIGNVTTVNDNNTNNQTRIGLTGMAMMQTNEIYSAEIFRKLKADYVLVYFGYLFNSLGGDEGKWQWMLRICNDNTETYRNYGLEKDNWAEDTVFEERDYVNTTSGRYRDNWFDSTLVKLLFYGVPTDPSQYQQGTLVYNYANAVQNNKDDNGNNWATHIPANGNYDLKAFIPAHFSTNGLVKLYKLDYTALDSNFKIEEPKVYDNGIATFKLENTGKENLTITNIQLNGQSYNFSMGSDDSGLLEINKTENIWIDVSKEGKSFSKNDIVKLNVTAQANALGGKTYTFSKQTSNFFVKEAKPRSLKINKNNSEVIVFVQPGSFITDAYLEVENDGEMILNLEDFYLFNESNSLSDVHYISGSPLLDAGQKARVYLSALPGSFIPFGVNHTLGVKTASGIKDEILLSASTLTPNKKYAISIIDRERIVAPEVKVATNDILRKNIPVNLNNSFGYTYNNGTTELFIKVKNIGNRDFVLDSINITGATNTQYVWDTINSDILMSPEEENIIKITTTTPDLYDINDNIWIMVSGDDDGTRVTSDVGYIQTIAFEPHIDIIEDIEDSQISYIAANETGRLLIKNTGNQQVSLNSIYLNNTLIANFSNTNQVNYIYGDSILGIQDLAYVTFNISGFKLNQSDITDIKVTTYSALETQTRFSAVVQSQLFNISIDETHSSAQNDADLTLRVNNFGIKNITIDSVYINETYISIENFTAESFEIPAGEFMEFILTDFEVYIPSLSINSGDLIEILIRSKEGAEDFIIEQVIS